MNLLVIRASWIAWAHTLIATAAFTTALLFGSFSGLWAELCANQVAKWPVEWFPSVSATIGDHAATRAPFHILIALCAGPRFLLLILHWASRPRFADAQLVVGLLRTLCCGGWMYITSRDQHDLHDFFMITYLVLNIPWMVLSVFNSRKAKRHRILAFSGFMLTVPPLIWQFYRHSVLRIPGSYTTYAFFEWSLVVWDIAFDAASARDLGDLRVAVVDENVQSQSFPKRPAPKEVDWTLAALPFTSPQATLSFLSDFVFNVAFVTAFTSLPMQLFYYSVWKLALAGSELALFANVSPYLLRHERIRVFSTSREGIIFNRALTMLLGLGMFWIPSPLARLVCVALAVGFGWLALLGNWTRTKGSDEMIAEGRVFTLALGLTIVLKHFNHSTNPFWLSTAAWTWNTIGLVFAALSVAEVYYRPISLFPSPSQPSAKISFGRVQEARFAVSFGALLHMIHTFATDGGTIIAWTWTGFPVTGPTVHPFGGIAAAVFLLATTVRPMNRFIGALGCFVVYRFPDWYGYCGGLAYAAFLIGILPEFFQAASTHRPVVIGHALLAYCLLGVISVVTAAYAFVPFGNLVRERTDLVLVFSTAAILTHQTISCPPRPTARKRIVFLNKWQRVLAVALAVIALRPIRTATPEPYSKHRLFSGGIWTVHFGVDMNGRDSQHRMKELLRDMEVDVVGLLESDLHRFVYGNRDLTRVIAEELGYYVDLGPGPNKHTWGAALLSKFPILNSTHHLLPSPHGELAPAIHATLLVHGEPVNVFVSHNGQEEDPLDRELQTTEIARLLMEVPGPTVFLGYLVTKPFDEPPSPYGIMVGQSDMIDIELEDTWRWCEYIFFRGLWRVAFGRIYESDITDTELQVGKFALPLPGKDVEYQSDKELYWHIGEGELPKAWHMPSMFRDEGVRGHHYVVWIGPLYYSPPKRSGLIDHDWT